MQLLQRPQTFEQNILYDCVCLSMIVCVLWQEEADMVFRDGEWVEP